MKINYTKIGAKLILMFIMLITISSFAAADLETDLDYFLNGEDYIDHSVNAYAVTNAGTSIVDDVYVFDGSNDYIRTSSFTHNFETSSISMRIKFDNNINTRMNNPIAVYEDGNNRFQLLFYNSDKVLLYSNCGGSTFTDAESNMFDTYWVNGDYNIVTMTSDGSSTTIYVNDNEITDMNLDQGLCDLSNAYVYTGSYGDGSTQTYEMDGNANNILIYGRELSRQEVTDLYDNAGNPIIITPAGNHTQQAFTDYQLNDVVFTTQNTYYEILTASVQNDNENATGYIDVEIQMESVQDVDVTCKVEINNQILMEGSRTNLGGTFGSLSMLSTNVSFEQYALYDLSLQCKKSGNGPVTISESRGIAHYIPNSIQFGSHNITYTGVTYSNGVLNSHNFLANYTGRLVMDYATSVFNNQGSTQEILSQVYVDGTPTCAEFKRDIDAGSSGSIGGSCSIDVVENTTYQLRTYFTGTNVDVTHQGHHKVLDNTNYTKVGSDFITSSDTLLATLTYDNTNNTIDELFIKSGLSMHNSGSDVEIWFDINGVATTPIIKTASGNDEVAITTYLNDITAQNYEVKLYAKSDGSTITLNDADFVMYPVNHFDRNLTTFTVQAYNEWGNASLTNFSITYDDLTISTTNGNITIFVGDDLNLDLTLSATDYFNLTELNHNVLTNAVLYPFQTLTSFNTKELVTNTSLSTITYVVDGVTDTQFHLAAGSYTVNASKFGYYDLLFNFTVPALYNDTLDIVGMYNSLINVTVTDKVVNTPVSNFTVNLVRGFFFNATDSTTSGSLLIPAIAGLEYVITTDAPGTYAVVDELITPLVGVYPYTISLYLLHSIQIDFIDSLTGENMSGTLVTIDIISNDFLYSTSLNTTTGQIQNQIVAPSSYIARYSAADYEERFYYFTLVPNGYNFLTLYMLENTSSQNVEVRIVDENDDIVIGALVKALKYNVETAVYELQEIAQTVNNGVATLHLSTEQEFYKFQVEVDGVTRITTLPDYIKSNQITLQVNLGTEAGDTYYEYAGIDSSLVFNEVTSNFRLTYNALDGITSNFHLYVYEFAAGEKTLIGSSSSLAPSGTLLVPVTLTNGTYYVAEAFYDTNKFLNSASHGVPDTDSLGNLGLLLQIFISIVFVAATVWEISLLPIALTLSILLGRLVHLNMLDYTGIIVAVVLSFIVSWFIKRYK